MKQVHHKSQGTEFLLSVESFLLSLFPYFLPLLPKLILVKTKNVGSKTAIWVQKKIKNPRLCHSRNCFNWVQIPPFLKAKIVITTGNFLQVFFISFISRTCGGESRLCLEENFVKKTTTTIITKLPVLHNFITYA